MTNKHSSDQFPTRLKARCGDLAQKYGYRRSELGRGFEGYVAHLFAQESGFQEILEGQDHSDPDLGEAILRSNDLGVDVVLEDSDNRQLLLVQTKWLGKGTRFPTDELESFFNLHNKLCEPAFIAAGGDMANELLGGYSDRVRDRYTMRFRFVTNRPLPATARARIILDEANKRYDKENTPVICEMFGQTELKELENQVKSTEAGILKSIEFAVTDNDAVEFQQPQHSLICRISGNVLTNLYNRHKQRLFALNIRLPMTLNRVINRAIRDTAESEPEDFFFYNNGVSAVCSSFSYDRKKNLVVAQRFQIINGAQTVGAIAGATSIDDLSVLFRLTATGDKYGGRFTDNIIRYNNTQNPIQISDFRANDQIQYFLKEHLTRRSGTGAAPSFMYQPKRGKRLTGEGGPALTSDQLARIRYSFIYGPVRTFREPKLLFDATDSGLYWWAFGDEGRKVDYWTEHQLDEATVAIALDHFFKREGTAMRKLMQAARKGESRGSEPQATSQGFGEGNYLYRLSRYLVGLVGVGLRIHYGRTFESYHELLSSESRFKNVTEQMTEDARQLVKFEVRFRTQTRAESQPDYNLARDDSTWDRLESQMREDTQTHLLKM
ncbi:MAG: AIPR family protein [Acidimicrobiaceae bacterium]|nr:AIPR family protein [Acidimicrobiaceae bacterium]